MHTSLIALDKWADEIWIKGTVSLMWAVCIDGYLIDDSRSRPILVPASNAFKTYILRLGGEKATNLFRDFIAMDWENPRQVVVREFANVWGSLTSIRGPEVIDDLWAARHQMYRILSDAQTCVRTLVVKKNIAICIAKQIVRVARRSEPSDGGMSNLALPRTRQTYPSG